MKRFEVCNKEYCYYRKENDYSDYSTIYVNRVLEDRHENKITEVPVNRRGVKIMKSRKDAISIVLEIIIAHEAKPGCY